MKFAFAAVGNGAWGKGDLSPVDNVVPEQSLSRIAVGRPIDAARNRSRTNKERQRFLLIDCSALLKMHIVSSLWRPRAKAERTAMPKL